jgi:transposase
MIQSIKVSVSFKDLRWSRHIPRLAKSFYIVLGHLAVDFLKNEKVIYWPTPPESPDLNPIECVWHEMKHYLRKYAKPKTKAELEQGIYGSQMFQVYCSLEKSYSWNNKTKRPSIRILID